MAYELDDTDYPPNLCGWSKWRKYFDPFGWCVAEIFERKQEYRLRLVESKVKGTPLPMYPSWLIMR